MAATKDINEVDLLYNLKNRLNEDKTFTNVGPTLIIVNPFKEIKNIYGSQMIDYYMEKQEKENPELRDKITEPHLYDLVLMAIREILKKNCKNQALIVSGESGAGKTVATKNSMQCIAYYFSKFKPENNNLNQSNNENNVNENETPLEKKILDCNPILEGFGNAKTVRNDNSSRFGKYIKIKLNKNSNIIEGAEMFTYLLEKSRITELNSLERSYHVFYYFLRGASDELLKEFHLTRDIKKYNYLWHDKNKNQVIDVASINDTECYKEIIDCFKSTNFKEEEIKEIFKVVSAVLLIGNIEIKVQNSVCTLTNKDVYKNICELLGIDSEPLLDAITRKFIPSEKKYGGCYDLTKIKSYFDGLAKDLYNKLFLWIVKKLNKTLDLEKACDNYKYIGLLDIFGFECFDKDHNSIEQLCINYTNEQLQQLYIKDIFESDKTEFRREGLEDKLYLLDASYKDNKDVIRLIKLFFLKISDVTMEDKKIYDLVKSFDNFIEKDKKFEKVKENKFEVSKFISPYFSVEHSAKAVEYSSNNFIDKNKDEIKTNVLKCILDSKNEIFKMIFTVTLDKQEFETEKEKLIDEQRVVPKNEKYLGLKFCKEMKELKKELKLCDHHYVRCIKPNEAKEPFLFHSNFVFNQIQYLGILATVQVRKNGFPMRRLYTEFFENFSIVLPRYIDKTANVDYLALCKEIIEVLIGQKEAENLKEQYLFGKTKIYMKQIFNQKLELRKIEILKEKIKAVSIIKIAVVKLKKKKKHEIASVSLEQIQKYLRVNKYKIIVQSKKDKIKKIQSMYLAHKGSKDIYDMSKNYYVIQNSLRILLSQKIIANKKHYMTFLTIQLKIFQAKIKERNRIKITAVTKNLIERVRQKIFYMEHNRLWQKVNPFFLRLLTARKYKQMNLRAKIDILRDKYICGFNILQQNLFFDRLRKKKLAIKTIYKNTSTKIKARYYKNLIINIKIIQKYMKIYCDQNDAFDKINDNYFAAEQELMLNEGIDTIENIFPNSAQKNNYYENNKKKQKSNEDDFFDNNNTLNFGDTLNNNNYKGKTIDKKSYEDTINSINKTNFLNTYNKNNKNANTINYNKYPDKNKIYTNNYKNTNNNNNFNNTNFNNSNFYNDTITTNISSKNSKKPTTKNLIPSFYNYNQPIITIFAKILDIDILYDSEETSDKSWNKEFMEIYKECLKNDTPIQKIEISNCHSLALSSDGKLYSWGWNNYGQCGECPDLTKQRFLFPNLNKINEKFPQLPILNYKENKNNLPLQHIINMTTNENFSMILTEKGNIISFGDNSYGQLGQGHHIEVFSAQCLKNYENKVKNIFSKGNINLFLTKKNEVYSWFISKEQELIKPKILHFPKKIKIETISCGQNFCILLSTNGICFGYGSNDYGELGIKNINFCYNPEEITELKKYNERIIQVSCGFKHVICVSVNGRVYTWGNNTYGQLGHKNNGNNLPLCVDFNEKNNRIKILQVCAGFRASFFLANKNIYYCGMLGSQKKSFFPLKFILNSKNWEICNEKEFVPVKIWSTFSKNKSIFYASMADIRSLMLKFNNPERVFEITNELSTKWVDNEIVSPFIPHLSKYFKSEFMKINKPVIGKVKK